MNTGNLPPDPESRLTAYLLGELSPAEKAEVDSRLESDRDWQLLLEQLRSTIELVSQATPFSDETGKEPLQLESNRREQLLQILGQTPHQEAERHSQHRIPWYLPVGIAASLMLTMGYLMFVTTAPRTGSLDTAQLIESPAEAEKWNWGLQSLGRTMAPNAEQSLEQESLRAKIEADFESPSVESGNGPIDNRSYFGIQVEKQVDEDGWEAPSSRLRRGREPLNRSLVERVEQEAEIQEDLVAAKRPESNQPTSASATAPARESLATNFRFATPPREPATKSRRLSLSTRAQERERAGEELEARRKAKSLARDFEVNSRSSNGVAFQESQIALDTSDDFQLGEPLLGTPQIIPQTQSNQDGLIASARMDNRSLFDTDYGIVQNPRGEDASRGIVAGFSVEDFGRGGGLGGGGGGGGLGGGGGGAAGSAAFGGRVANQSEGFNGRYEGLALAPQGIDRSVAATGGMPAAPTPTAKPSGSVDVLDSKLAKVELNFADATTLSSDLATLGKSVKRRERAAGAMRGGEALLAGVEPSDVTRFNAAAIDAEMAEYDAYSREAAPAPTTQRYFFSQINIPEPDPLQDLSDSLNAFGDLQSPPVPALQTQPLQESLSQFESEAKVNKDVALLAIQPDRTAEKMLGNHLGFQIDAIGQQIAEIESEPLAELADKVAAATELYAKLEAEKPEGRPTLRTEDREVAQAAFPVEKETQQEPTSTFSLNVSDVSFQLSAASLQEGRFPDPASIRPEEFFNALSFHDPATRSMLPLSIHTERTRFPYGFRQDVLRISVRTKSTGRSSTQPLNVVIALDNSGSMKRPDRQQIIHRTLRSLLATLKPNDTVSVVAFSRTPRLLADGMTGASANELDTVLDQMIPEGGTNLEAALSTAYDTARKHFQPTGQNRVILFTDGAANLGNTSSDSLRQIVIQNRKQGIALDCFGIGWDGYEDVLLEALTRNGDGRYGFLNRVDQVESRFLKQLTGALNVAAKNVKVQILFNERRVRAYRQIGFAQHQLKKEDFRNNQVDAAEIAADEAGTALYVLQMLPDGEGPIGELAIRYQDPQTGEYHELDWPLAYSGPSGAFETATPKTQLATLAGVFAERLGGIPYSQSVSYQTLAERVQALAPEPQLDPTIRQLKTMIQQTQQLSGF